MAETMSDNKQRMLRGDLYHAFTPELIQVRRRCQHACERFNRAHEPTRREQVIMIRE